jgi:hemolysin activation/secretion protein
MDERIKRINAELLPGITQGDSVLKLKVEENKPYRVVLQFSNSQSPSIGAYKGEITIAHQSLLGLGDMLEGTFGLTAGSNDYNASYSIPITARDTKLMIYYRKSDDVIIDDLFKKLQIESRTSTLGLALSHPVYQTPAESLTLSLACDVRRSETFLLGQPFSFTDIEDNVTHVTAIRFSQDWVKRSRNEVIAVRSNLSVGLRLFNATISKTGTDGQFISWAGQAQWIRQLSQTGIQMVLRTDVQLANDSLLPMERFAVGGMNSVRGYRENQLTRDNGIVGSLEFRLPIIKDRNDNAILQFAPFSDIGWSWDTKKSSTGPESISSIGAGLRWMITDNMRSYIYAGHPFRRSITRAMTFRTQGSISCLYGMCSDHGSDIGTKERTKSARLNFCADSVS